MQKWYRTILFVMGTAAVVAALAACGGGTSTASKLCNGQISIASEFPTTGADGADGKPAQNAVELAVKQANVGGGYTLSFISYNDVSAALGKHDPDQGVKNVTNMVANKCILGFVGPFNSNVAKAEIPVSENAGLVMISPANTNPGLTVESEAAANGMDWPTLHPAGKPETYFRIPGNDIAQGTVDADLTVAAKPDGLGATKVYVVDDQETYGVGIANYYEKELKAKGGTELGRDGIPANGNAQIPGLAAKIAATHPDAVYFGGLTSTGGPQLKAQLVQAGYTGPMIGGDGIGGDPEFIKEAGAAAEGTYGSSGAPDPSTLTNGVATKFFADYTAAYPTEDYGTYRANSFDAANILIAAIKSIISGGKDLTRAAMITAVQATQYDGATGHISFDAHGDNAGGGIWAFYVVQGGKWVFLTQTGGGS
jgi:branched-chain amino acid transport system substrate-binding protein